MRSLTSPGGALDAARSFFTPPAVTPVDGPAAWFAAQRGTRAGDAAARRPTDPDAVADAIEEFELGGDSALDAPDLEVLRTGRDGAPRI